MDANDLTPKDVGRVVKTQWDDGEFLGILIHVDHPDDPGLHSARMLMLDNDNEWTEQGVEFDQIISVGNHVNFATIACHIHIPEVKLESTEPV